MVNRFPKISDMPPHGTPKPPKPSSTHKRAAHAHQTLHLWLDDTKLAMTQAGWSDDRIASELAIYEPILQAFEANMGDTDQCH